MKVKIHTCNPPGEFLTQLEQPRDRRSKGVGQKIAMIYYTQETEQQQSRREATVCDPPPRGTYCYAQYGPPPREPLFKKCHVYSE